MTWFSVFSIQAYRVRSNSINKLVIELIYFEEMLSSQNTVYFLFSGFYQ